MQSFNSVKSLLSPLDTPEYHHSLVSLLLRRIKQVKHKLNPNKCLYFHHIRRDLQCLARKLLQVFPVTSEMALASLTLEHFTSLFNANHALHGTNVSLGLLSTRENWHTEINSTL